MLNRLYAPLIALGLTLAVTGCTILQAAPAAPAAERVTIAEPANLSLLKWELMAYLDDGRYDAGVATVAAQAKAWVEQRAAQGGKLAIIFDLDETLLSNLKHIRSMDFGYVPPLWDNWVASADCPVIEPVVAVYRAARANNVTVFYMTGRKTSDAPGTIKNLQLTGLDDYAGLYFKPNDYMDTTQSFKTAMRQKITEAGYTIIANVGDQHSDLDGGYSERTFKLPNPFYMTK
ncbi:MAG: HAD family acid phosphatase [Candidatus Didemnitutus sp.]|nr:HAD family acid phosphatase [Candidatus Didemnitutus sp.]